MKRFLIGLLAMIIAVAGIEPIALIAAGNDTVDENVKIELEKEIEEFIGGDLEDYVSNMVSTPGEFKTIEELQQENSKGRAVSAKASTVASGKCGSNANWALDSDAILWITGSGAIYDYASTAEQPWGSYATSIRGISVGDGITRIGDGAFGGFQNVEAVQFANSVKEIGTFAFMAFTSLDTTFTLGQNISLIEPGAFAVNPYLEYSINNNSKYYSANGHIFDKELAALIQAGNLSEEQKINLPSDVELIYPAAMAYGSYRSFDNSNIKYVGAQAFEGCSELKNVKMDSLITIGAGAFLYCEKLGSFTVPASTTEIYEQAFAECTSLSTITFKGNAPTIGENIFYNVVATANYDSSKSGWTSSVRKNYGGTITWKDVNQSSKQNNTITASSVTKTASASSQSFSLGASAKDNASLSYSSNNSNISVNSSGKCTISANYIGSATITIKAAATSNYKETTKTITVTVLPVKAQITSLTSSGTTVTMKVNNDIGNVEYDIRYSTSSDMSSSKYSYCNDYSSSGIKVSGLTSGKTYYFQVRGTKLVDGSYYDGVWSESKKITVGKKNQTITAKNISKTVSSSERKIAINASTNGNGKLTYKSDNSKIKIKSGKVVIPKNFIGKATITITAASTSKYSKATKKITVTVKPVKATINSVKNNKKGVITIKAKKNIGSVKYQVQIAKDSEFENKISKILSYKSEGWTASVTKGNTYYVRVRGYKKVNDKPYYGKWSDVKKIKVSK